MSRIIISLSVIGLLFGFCVGELFYVKKICDETAGYARAIEENLSDKEKAEEIAREFALFWEEKDHIISRLLRYDRLGEIAQTVPRFLPLIEEGEEAEVKAEAEKVKRIIHDAWESEKPTLKNIF